MHYPFKNPPLPYQYSALEPNIDSRTLHFHHDKHLQTYVDNLNKALEGHPQYQNWTLEELIAKNHELPDELRNPVKNNAGGVYNHILYFESMCSPNTCNPSGKLEQLIKDTWGSLDIFYAKLKEAALGQFGSGWAWLLMDVKGELHIKNTPNQDVPPFAEFYPLLLVDVWEHAYYLQYQNLRAGYFDCWVDLINWKNVEQRFETACTLAEKA